MKEKISWYDCLSFLWYEWVVLILLPQYTGGDSLRGPVIISCSFLSVSLMLLLLFLIGRKNPRPALSPSWMIWVGAVLLSASKLLSYFGQRFAELPLFVTPFYTLMAGAAFAFLFYSFSQLLGTMNLSQLRPLLVRSQVVGMGIYLLMSVLYNTSGLLFGATEMTFPLIAAVAIVNLHKKGDSTESRSGTARIDNPAAVIWRTTPLMIIFAIATGMLLGRMPSMLFGQGHTITAALVLLSLFAALAYLGKRSLISSILNLGKGGLVLGVVGVMAFLLSNQTAALGYGVLTTGYFLFYTAMFIFFVTFLRYQDKEGPGETLSLVMSADSLGIALGVIIGRLLMAAPHGSQNLALLVIGVVFLGAISYLFNKKALFPITDKISEPTQASKESIGMACMQMAQNYGLTPRQSEIFTLLAYGHRIPGIANMLGISAATVRTHAHFIYTKLEVHSSEELIELVRKATANL